MFKQLAYLMVLSMVLLGAKSIYAETASDSSAKIVRGNTTINVPAPTETVIKEKATARSHQRLPNSVWVYEYAISILDDFDYDGFYTAFDLWLDLDTSMLEQNILIDLFIVDDFGNTELIYTSNAFTLFSNSENDGINIHIDLGQGYPENQYHLMIDIYDADHLDFITTYDHYELSRIGHLPLESYEFDTTSRYVVTETSYGVSTGGTTGLSLLLLLTMTLAIRVGLIKKPESDSQSRL